MELTFRMVTAAQASGRPSRVTSASKAAVTYFGYDGADAVVAGGRIAGGAFTSNRSATTKVPGRAVLVLPIFEDADPAIVELDAIRAGADGYLLKNTEPEDLRRAILRVAEGQGALSPEAA